jgi:hypothetical protein
MANILDDKKKNEPVVGAVSPAPIASASTAPVAAPVAAPAQYTPTPIQRASVSMPVDRAFRSPADQSMNQARAWAAQQSVGVNQQLQMHRNEMGTTDTSLTQMAAQLDPSIRQDAERARQWRIMSPQQRRDEVDRLAMEQDARTADQLFAGTWEDQQKYTRSLADPTGMFIDSFGRENPMYSPGTAERIRGYQRKIEPAIARMMSSYDRTKWDSPQAFWDAVSALPEVIEAGEFGKSIVFNIVRKYATPQMRAQMEAEDRNQKLFKDWMVSRGAEEIGKAQEANGGFRFTNDGTEDLATQIFLNRDKDLASGQIWRQFLAETPQIYTAMDGKVVFDQAHAAKYQASAQQKATQEERDYREKQAKKTKDDALLQKEQAAKETIKMRDEANPIQRGRFRINPVSKEIEDTYEYTQGDIARLSEDERVRRSSALLEEISTWSGLLGFENETDETIAARIEAMKPNLMNPALAEKTQAGIDNLMANWNLYKSMGGAEEIKYEIEAKKRLRNKYKGVQ